MISSLELAKYADELLQTSQTPDYPSALNGLQLTNREPITKIAAAVDFSLRSISGAAAAGANLLLVHHGMFWPGLEPITGVAYRRLRLLFDNDIAVYASHLPLDRHPTLGNNALLASQLDLEPSGLFARYNDIFIGVAGESNTRTSLIADRAREFAARWGGVARTTSFASDRITKRWAICTGAGAGAETLREAEQLGVDTLIVGEGAHWTAVHAEQHDLVIIYAGHYATETLGVRALGQHLSDRFHIPLAFIDAPTGL